MFAVTRPTLAEWTLDSDAVLAVANAWWGWCRLNDVAPGAAYSLLWEARFEGFAPNEAARFEEHLRKRTITAGMPGHVVRRESEETLIVHGFATDPEQEQAIGPLTHCLAAPEFNHLSLRVRFISGRVAGKNAETQTTSAALTLFGLLRDGRFVVQTVWQGGPESDVLIEHAPDANEPRLLESLRDHVNVDHLLAEDLPPGTRWLPAPRRFKFDSPAEARDALDHLRRLTGNSGGSTDEDILTVHATVNQVALAISQTRRPKDLVLAMTPGQERSANWLVWLLFGNQRKRSLGDWIRRLAVAIGLTTAGWAAAAHLPGGFIWLFIAVATVGGLSLCWMVGYQGMLMWMYKTQMSRGLRDNAYQPAGIVPVSFAELGLIHNPVVSRHSVELESLGAQLHAEIRLESVKTATAATRIYVLSRDHTVFSLSFMTGLPNQFIFPARVNFHLETRFTDGLRLVSGNSGLGYRKPLPSSKYVPRYWPEANTVSAILARHRAVIQRLVSEGRQVQPLEVSDILPRMDREHGSERAERDQFGWYLWSDAFHEVFDLVRKEYQEPGRRN